MSQVRRIAGIATIALIFSACGGGGGGGSAPPPVSSTSPPVTTLSSGFTAGTSSTTTAEPAFNRNTPNNGRPFAFNKPGMRALVQSVNPVNPLEQTILHCTVTLRDGQECSLNRLPLLGMETSSPRIDEIMSRVLVSHEWMGIRFRELLEVLPPEVLLLTRGLTAIVISHDIRPSFYTTQTGAIYLDPDGMWLNETEKNDIDTAPDFRSSFGSDLQFVMLWRYVKNNEYVTRAPRSGTRTIDDIKFGVAALLYHELAHANDYFSMSRQDSADTTVPIYVAARGVGPSSRLSSQFSLGSETMFGLARVSFLGGTANETQMALLPDDIETEFAADYASDYYNYSSQREDLAMAFEEAMMLFSFGVDRDVAITNRPGTNTCSDFLVTWGQRNRIADPAVGVRANYSVGELLPEFADQVELVVNAMNPPIQMIVGDDWCENLILDNSSSARSLRLPSKAEPPVEWLVPYL
jgi:hypothetical protein